MKSRDRERLRTAANVLGVLVLIAVVVPFLIYGVPQVVGADHGFVVLSGSMEPAMSPGDAVIVREASPEEITERDIITFRTGSETPTTHRVIDVTERDGGASYVTKGDANEDPDATPVSHDQVLGEVILVIPVIGYAIQFVNTPVGFGVIVLLPLGLLAISEIRRLQQSVRPSSEGAAGTAETSETNPETFGSASQSTEADASNSADGQFTLTESSLVVLSVVFGLYLPYSAYVAYRTVEMWSVSVAVATGLAFLGSTAMYAQIALGESASESDGDDNDVENVQASAANDSSDSPQGEVVADGGDELPSDEQGGSADA